MPLSPLKTSSKLSYSALKRQVVALANRMNVLTDMRVTPVSDQGDARFHITSTKATLDLPKLDDIIKDVDDLKRNFKTALDECLASSSGDCSACEDALADMKDKLSPIDPNNPGDESSGVTDEIADAIAGSTACFSVTDIAITFGLCKDGINVATDYWLGTNTMCVKHKYSNRYDLNLYGFKSGYSEGCPEYRDIPGHIPTIWTMKNGGTPYPWGAQSSRQFIDLALEAGAFYLVLGGMSGISTYNNQYPIGSFNVPISSGEIENIKYKKTVDVDANGNII